jgi:hypothetical protein
VRSFISNKKQSYAPRTFTDMSLLKQYTTQMLKTGLYYRDKFVASRLMAESNHIQNDGKTLARRIRALCRHYQTFRGLPTETRGGKRKGSSYLNNKDVFQACRAWLLQQELSTISPNNFRIAINKEILPRLMISYGASLGQTSTYNWLLRLGFYKSEVKKGVYLDRHEREDIVAYRQEVFLPLMAELDSYTRQYNENNDGSWKVIEPILPPGVQRHMIYCHNESYFHRYNYKKTIWLNRITEQQRCQAKVRASSSTFLILLGQRIGSIYQTST